MMSVFDHTHPDNCNFNIIPQVNQIFHTFT